MLFITDWNIKSQKGQKGLLVLLLIFWSYTQDIYQPHCRLTRYVGSDLCESGLAEAFGRASPNRDQVGGSGVQAREHVVGFIPQLGDCAARTGNVDARVRGFNALVADLQTINRREKTTGTNKTD